MDLLNSSYQPPLMVYNYACLLGLVCRSKSLFHIYYIFTSFLCFNELYHTYLFVRTCLSVYHMIFAEVRMYDYCGDYSLQFGDKIGFR